MSFISNSFKIGITLFVAIILGLLGWLILRFLSPATPPPAHFDSERAYQDVIYQTNLGPRTSRSQAHEQAVAWMQRELESFGWQVEIQEGELLGHPIRNVVARRPRDGMEEAPWIILGAHYDSRLVADADPEPARRTMPVPGANDGASGVAVLLELARVIPKDLPLEVWLAFFDAEDKGRLPGWDWV